MLTENEYLDMLHNKFSNGYGIAAIDAFKLLMAGKIDKYVSGKYICYVNRDTITGECYYQKIVMEKNMIGKKAFPLFPLTEDIILGTAKKVPEKE